MAPRDESMGDEHESAKKSEAGGSGTGERVERAHGEAARTPEEANAMATALQYEPAGALDMAVYNNVRGSLFGSQAGAPHRLGRYVVLGTLGRGGMGVVLRAFDLELDRQVALKVLHEHLGDRQTARLRREAQAMAKLSHPNVVQVYEVGQVDGRTFVAMELVRGQTPRQWMKQDPRPGWKACVRLFIRLGQGLAAAHEQGLVHRDFKPDNAIIDGKGRPRVLDFGLARRDDPVEVESEPEWADALHSESADTSLTRTGVVMGTPAYMPPEQMRGRDTDARSDQFSFCVSLYEVLYGQRPFVGSSSAQLLVAIEDGEIKPVPRGPTIPAALRKAVVRGMAAEPGDRWPSMEALLAELRAIVKRPLRRAVGMGGVAVLALAALGTRALVVQSEQLIEKDDEITDKQARIEEQFAQLQQRDRRLSAEL
ncbi:MAG: serine/threonine protein kinase, partial [Deltaproteobacteria bacterium]|nr:serine/threonine protein kinase [Deltaproteobacteria bacterium]